MVMTCQLLASILRRCHKIQVWEREGTFAANAQLEGDLFEIQISVSNLSKQEIMRE
jgi:hypothetical protein